MSYSTPANLYKIIGEKLQYQLTADTSDSPDNTVAQDVLDASSNDIDIRIGNRYVVPVTAPPAQLTRLAGLEEQIGHWRLFVRKGFSEDDPAAKAAFSQADRAYKLLDAIASGDIDLTGVLVRVVPAPGTPGAAGWKSNSPVYTNDNFRLW